MLRLAPHSARVLAWLLATACAAHASGAPDQFKLMIGSMLMSDYALGRDPYRRPTGLAPRLYELQQRAVFDQPRRRGDGDRRRAPDARSVRVRYRRGLLLLSRRARAGAVQLLGGARHGIVQADRQDHAGTDPRLRPQRLADRRLGHLRSRHALVRSVPRRRAL